MTDRKLPYLSEISVVHTQYPTQTDGGDELSRLSILDSFKFGGPNFTVGTFPDTVLRLRDVTTARPCLWLLPLLFQAGKAVWIILVQSHFLHLFLLV